MNLIEQIEQKLSSAKACKFKTGKQLKRKDGDWDIVYDWALYDANDNEIKCSEWEGFPDLTTCLKDLLKNIK